MGVGRARQVLLDIGVGAGNFWLCEGLLPEFSQTFPKKLQKKPLHIILGAIFFKLKPVGRHHFDQMSREFVMDFKRFFPDFKGFFPDFHQIKTFGGALSPPPPTLVLLDVEIRYAANNLSVEKCFSFDFGVDKNKFHHCWILCGKNRFLHPLQKSTIAQPQIKSSGPHA